jgi:predicted phosphodiesterase
MAFAIFADIHGNLEALEAIIKDAKKKRGVKEIYFLGDAITFGADSSACLKLLRDNNIKCVVGNHEQRIVRYDKAVKSMTYATPEHMNYIFSQLDQGDMAFIKTMPVSIKTNYRGVNIFFTHYAHDADGVIRDTYDEFTEIKMHKMFDEYKSDVVFFGHVHSRKIIIDEGGKSYVCLGSSGCVKADTTFYTYFEVNREGQDINFDIYRVTVPFNRKRFDEKMRRAPLPNKEVYAKFTFGMELSPSSPL